MRNLYPISVEYYVQYYFYKDNTQVIFHDILYIYIIILHVKMCSHFVLCCVVSRNCIAVCKLYGLLYMFVGLLCNCSTYISVYFATYGHIRQLGYYVFSIMYK